MCPFCGLITPRRLTCCLECGKPFKFAHQEITSGVAERDARLGDYTEWPVHRHFALAANQICVQNCMQMKAQLRAIERLEKRSELVLRLIWRNLLNDPDPLRQLSRSKMIALRHSINQIYGDAAGVDVANALAPAV